MCDLFSSLDARSVLHKKRVLFLGDSNIRSYYKDLVYLVENNKLLSSNALKNKLSSVVPGDIIKKGSKLHRGRDYFEIREYKHNSLHIEFHFLTKCYTPDICHMFKKFKEVKEYPDIIIMNSCLWDISRWGPNGVIEYKDNLLKLMKLLKSCLPEETLFIWTCVPPVSNKCRGGLLVRQVEFLQHSLRFDIMEGNMFARDTVVSHGFDILDIHYYLRMQIHWRATDGIHWLPHAVRHVTNLILTHICVALKIRLPGNNTNESIQRFQSLAVEIKKEKTCIKLPELQSKFVMSQNHKPSKGSYNYASKISQLESETSILSPRRKAIVQRKKYFQGGDHIGDNSVFNSSITSLDGDGDDSFKLDVSLEIPLEEQLPGSHSFDISYDIQTMINSPLPSYKDHERNKLTGPIRFHHVDRKYRARRGPYSFY